MWSDRPVGRMSSYHRQWKCSFSPSSRWRMNWINCFSRVFSIFRQRLPAMISQQKIRKQLDEKRKKDLQPATSKVTSSLDPWKSICLSLSRNRVTSNILCPPISAYCWTRATSMPWSTVCSLLLVEVLNDERSLNSVLCLVCRRMTRWRSIRFFSLSFDAKNCSSVDWTPRNPSRRAAMMNRSSSWRSITQGSKSSSIFSNNYKWRSKRTNIWRSNRGQELRSFFPSSAMSEMF